MPMSMSRVLLLVLALGSLSRAAAAQEFQVVAHPSVAVSAVTASELSDVFFKKASKLGGAAVVPVDQGKASPVRAAFAKRVHGRAVSAVDAFWQQQIFSGGDSPPASKAGDDEVVAFVKATPGAIGYVSAAAGTGGLKVLTLK